MDVQKSQLEGRRFMQVMLRNEEEEADVSNLENIVSQLELKLYFLGNEEKSKIQG